MPQPLRIDRLARGTGRDVVAASRLLQNVSRVPRDHELLVGRDHPGRYTARRRAEPRPVGLVGESIQVEAEPRGVAADTFAQTHAVLADAAREDDGVEAAQRCGE